MPLTTRYPNGVNIFDAAALVLDTPAMMDEVPMPADEGFDEVLYKYLLRASNHATPQAAMMAHFPRGRAIPGRDNLWVRTAQPREVGAGLYELEVRAHGRIGPIRYTRQVDAQATQSQAENVTVTTPVDYPFTYPDPAERFQANEFELTCRTNYVATTAPDYAQVAETVYGGNPLPTGYPALPSGPASKWTYLSDPLWIYPAGWVLTARPADAIRDETGTEVCWHVQDIHAYYQVARP